jgi:hypothetical protein
VKFSAQDDMPDAGARSGGGGPTGRSKDFIIDCINPKAAS